MDDKVFNELMQKEDINLKIKSFGMKYLLQSSIIPL